MAVAGRGPMSRDEMLRGDALLDALRYLKAIFPKTTDPIGAVCVFRAGFHITRELAELERTGWEFGSHGLRAYFASPEINNMFAVLREKNGGYLHSYRSPAEAGAR